MMEEDGYVLFDPDAGVAAWVAAAEPVACAIADDPVKQRDNLRHGRTWFVGVDALPNDATGAVDGVPFTGPWVGHVPTLAQHAAQLSIIYPGYPQRDADQSAANHRYRTERCAAHVDGLLPEGAARRRYAREFHCYILGVPLNDVPVAPTVVWVGSHKIMQQAIAAAIADKSVGEVDITDAYHAARREVFERCKVVPIVARPGQSFLIHRFALHGTAPWEGPVRPGRMIAFFRPECANPADWLAV